MRGLIAFSFLMGLVACSTGPETATFSCTRGPEIAIVYSDDTAILTFADGRTEVLPSDPNRPGFYAKSGLVWSETAFRTGRLTNATSSYSCDQSSV
ncbi:MAG: hypothetical protein ABJF50_15325 [Paracoccaceae bacterium]